MNDHTKEPQHLDDLREQLLHARASLALAGENEAGLNDTINTLRLQVTELADALIEIAIAAEDHPAYLGKGLSIDAINAEGGDSAFITLDIAYSARTALAKVRRLVKKEIGT